MLSESEINELYALPNFNRKDRDDYFSLDSETQRLVNELRRIETRVYFILLLGYFRSRPIVFNFSFTQVSNDLDYVRSKYFSDKDMSLEDLSPTTKTKLINKLLKYTGFTAYHQLKRAITSVNGNKFRGENDYQVSQWNDCARLISNCIIYYNSALLSAFLQIQERNGRQDVVDVISRLSPVAWQHINLNGEYAFNKDRKEIDLAGLLSDVESIS
ncbi:Tn3 family transposase [Pseudoalteromonas sp. APC 3224]|nr:Tn3 family transposase [Pseudoalteromonas sp. APC 3224]MDN3485291.1 Tn3 family transposase [Pseudoalteromonas sp. APC 3224]